MAQTLKWATAHLSIRLGAQARRAGRALGAGVLGAGRSGAGRAGAGRAGAGRAGAGRAGAG